MPEIQRISIKHEAIMDFMLANPAMKLGDVALHFQVSQAWLSIIIHSDAFQSRLTEKKQDLFGATLVPLREKLLGIAHLGVEKTAEALEHASPITDKDYIRDTTDSILEKLGYSAKAAGGAPAGGNQTNIYLVDKDDLAEARNRMRSLYRQDRAAIEGEVVDETSKGNTTEEF